MLFHPEADPGKILILPMGEHGKEIGEAEVHNIVGVGGAMVSKECLPGRL